MKLYCLNRNRILLGTVCALAALSIGGCSGAQDSTYSLVSQKTVGASDAVAPAQEPTATAPIPAGQSELALTAEEKKANNLIGVWEGTTRASCEALIRFADRCNALQVVKMTLIRGDNSKLVGHYTCAYGNMDCFHLNETGKIVDASLNGRRVTMRVMMPDGTSCTYTGRTNESNEVDGGYSCTSGGSLLEQGTWHAKRSY
jgi:hypothetical protein